MQHLIMALNNDEAWSNFPLEKKFETACGSKLTVSGLFGENLRDNSVDRKKVL